MPATKSPTSRTRRRVGNAVGVLMVGFGLYAWLVEPSWVEVTRHEVHVPIRAPLKIAHLTDLHTHGLRLRERRVIESLEREQPDLIAITGDTVDDGHWETARPLLEKLHAPLGVWLVDGNWEHWRAANDTTALFTATKVHHMTNDAASVREDLSIVGLDDAFAGMPNPTRALAGLAPSASPTSPTSPTSPATCALVLFHSPEYFDTIVDSLPACAIVLAGHTHGGQVRMPFFGALWTPPGSGSYRAGWYAKHGRRMYVSRGVGTSILDVRFNCRPELAYITLVPP